MKILIKVTLMFVIIMLTSCQTPIGESVQSTDKNYTIKTIDGHEYIEYDSGIFDQRVYSLTHKADCKLCKKEKLESEERIINEIIKRMKDGK